MNYCDRCDGEHEREENTEREREQHRLRIARAGIPEPLQQVTFEGASDPVAVRLCEGWALRDEPVGVLLHGDVGRGKTWLAAAAANLRLRRAAVRWVSVARLMTMLRGEFGDGRQGAQDLLTSHDPLVLDDLDKASPTPFGREVLQTALDERVQAGVPLLVTTNLDSSEMAEQFGKAILSRLIGHCTVHEVTGPDRRIKG